MLDMDKKSTKELAEVMLAYANGESVQFRAKNDMFWHDAFDNFLKWDFENFDYRIKPLPTYHPYKNAEEFAADAIKHRLVCKEKSTGIYKVITAWDDKCVDFGNANACGFGPLFGEYVWADDQSRCGVRNEE